MLASRWVPHSLPPPPLPLRFATKERDGLLLYNGRFNEKHDFVALEVIQEQVQLTFSAGDPAAPRPRPSPCASPPLTPSHTLSQPNLGTAQPQVPCPHSQPSAGVSAHLGPFLRGVDHHCVPVRARRGQ